MPGSVVNLERSHRVGIALWLACLASGLPAPGRAADILVNGHFDAMPLGTGWTQVEGGAGHAPIVTGSELPPGITPHSPANAAWLGGFDAVTQSIAQNVTVPAGADKLKLTGRLRIDTEEFGGVYDILNARLTTTGGATLETLHIWSNANENTTWDPFTYQATGNYAGQTIRLVFTAANDIRYVTHFFLDTISLDASSTVDVTGRGVPSPALSPASPNPARDVTRLRLDLPSRVQLRASIHDLAGRVVRELASGVREPGTHDLRWDATGSDGARVAAGIYFCVVDAGGRRLTQRVGVVR